MRASREKKRVSLKKDDIFPDSDDSISEDDEIYAFYLREIDPVKSLLGEKEAKNFYLNSIRKKIKKTPAGKGVTSPQPADKTPTRERSPRRSPRRDDPLSQINVPRLRLLLKLENPNIEGKEKKKIKDDIEKIDKEVKNKIKTVELTGPVYTPKPGLKDDDKKKIKTLVEGVARSFDIPAVSPKDVAQPSAVQSSSTATPVQPPSVVQSSSTATPVQPPSAVQSSSTATPVNQPSLSAAQAAPMEKEINIDDDKTEVNVKDINTIRQTKKGNEKKEEFIDLWDRKRILENRLNKLKIFSEGEEYEEVESLIEENVKNTISINSIKEINKSYTEKILYLFTKKYKTRTEKKTIGEMYLKFDKILINGILDDYKTIIDIDENKKKDAFDVYLGFIEEFFKFLLQQTPDKVDKKFYYFLDLLYKLDEILSLNDKNEHQEEIKKKYQGYNTFKGKQFSPLTKINIDNIKELEVKEEEEEEEEEGEEEIKNNNKYFEVDTTISRLKEWSNGKFYNHKFQALLANAERFLQKNKKKELDVPKDLKDRLKILAKYVVSKIVNLKEYKTFNSLFDVWVETDDNFFGDFFVKFAQLMSEKNKNKNTENHFEKLKVILQSYIAENKTEEYLEVFKYSLYLQYLTREILKEEKTKMVKKKDEELKSAEESELDKKIANIIDLSTVIDVFNYKGDEVDGVYRKKLAGDFSLLQDYKTKENLYEKEKTNILNLILDYLIKNDKDDEGFSLGVEQIVKIVNVYKVLPPRDKIQKYVNKIKEFIANNKNLSQDLKVNLRNFSDILQINYDLKENFVEEEAEKEKYIDISNFNQDITGVENRLEETTFVEEVEKYQKIVENIFSLNGKLKPIDLDRLQNLAKRESDIFLNVINKDEDFSKIKTVAKTFFPLAGIYFNLKMENGDIIVATYNYYLNYLNNSLQNYKLYMDNYNYLDNLRIFFSNLEDIKILENQILTYVNKNENVIYNTLQRLGFPNITYPYNQMLVNILNNIEIKSDNIVNIISILQIITPVKDISSVKNSFENFVHKITNFLSQSKINFSENIFTNIKIIKDLNYISSVLEGLGVNISNFKEKINYNSEINVTKIKQIDADKLYKQLKDVKPTIEDFNSHPM